jgi:hypothetical protein
MTQLMGAFLPVDLGKALIWDGLVSSCRVDKGLGISDGYRNQVYCRLF